MMSTTEDFSVQSYVLEPVADPDPEENIDDKPAEMWICKIGEPKVDDLV